ncbi:MAG TPA: GlsB/YeaQ/YmgE family stress response membrane protein [Candidatus Dormibacteraeota bacterium]|nr:GlsB/YeaQ/YmgE family stress response membrane protein [Candidatus Dormibacteraeota bacterium]
MSLGDILIFAFVGLVAGFLASLVVMGRGRGWFWNLIIGILGAIFGGWLAGVLHISINIGPSIVNRIIVAFAGAVILLLIWRLLFRRGKK